MTSPLPGWARARGAVSARLSTAKASRAAQRRISERRSWAEGVARLAARLELGEVGLVAAAEDGEATPGAVVEVGIVEVEGRCVALTLMRVLPPCVRQAAYRGYALTGGDCSVTFREW